MSILDEIVTQKKKRLSAEKGNAPLSELKARCKDRSPARPFEAAIRRPPGERIRIIAEIKKASPSKGVIRRRFDPAAIAAVYEEKSAAAISVVTEEDFFQGSLSFLQGVKDLAARPVLRKDFIVDEYQLYESRLAGADAVLLIAAILGRGQKKEYLQLAHELGMAVLFEVHDGGELDAVLEAGATIVGINNRDLRTMKISLDTTIDMLPDIPGDRVIVSESGIGTGADVERFEKTRVDALLIGTAFMKEEDIGRKFDEMTASPV